MVEVKGFETQSEIPVCGIYVRWWGTAKYGKTYFYASIEESVSHFSVIISHNTHPFIYPKPGPQSEGWATEVIDNAGATLAEAIQRIEAHVVHVLKGAE
jgi:hypothetical protein